MYHSLLRSGVSFLLLLVIGRWVVRGRLGKFGIFELLTVNALGDLASHLAFETQHPLAGGLTTMLFWAVAVGAVGWLSSRFRWAERLFYRQPQSLVQDGQPDLRALARARMTMAELESELRRQGVQQLSDAKAVTLEPEGSLSVEQRESVQQTLKRLAATLNDLADRLPAEHQPPQ